MFKIVAVDDCPVMGMILGELFHRNDALSATIFSRGDEAISYALTHDVDLFVIDWNMPFYEGKDLLKDLRQIEKYAHTPIVVLSGDDDLEVKLEAQYLGATEWFVKPFSSIALSKFLHQIHSMQSIRKRLS